MIFASYRRDLGWAATFLLLSFVGLALLPGLAAYHGLLDFMARTIKSGKIRTHYTGIGPVDRELAVLIAFFEAALDRPGLRALVFSFSGLLATTLTVADLAASSSNSLVVKLLPLPLGILCQAYGAGLAFPLLYCLFYMFGIGRKQVKDTRGWLPALVLTFIVPGGPMIMPLIKNLDQTRLVCALWQVFPVTLFFARPVLRLVSPSQSPKSTLRLVGWLGLVMHSIGLVDLYMNREFVKMLDFTSRVPSEVGAVFLFNDYAMVVVSTVMFVLVSQPNVEGGKIAALSIIAGPGAAIAWALADAADPLPPHIEKAKNAKKSQ